MQRVQAALLLVSAACIATGFFVCAGQSWDLCGTPSSWIHDGGGCGAAGWYCNSTRVCAPTDSHATVALIASCTRQLAGSLKCGASKVWRWFRMEKYDAVLALLLYAILVAAKAVLGCGTAVLMDAMYVPFLVRHGLAVRTAHTFITHPPQQVFISMLAGILSCGLLPSAVEALALTSGFMHASVDFSVQPLKMLWATTVTFLLHDVYYYWVHRCLHASRLLYKHIHAHHHDPGAMMEARTALVMGIWEGFVMHGVFHTAAIMLNLWLFTDGHHVNVWTVILPGIASIQAGLMGHSGVKFLNPLALLAVNPLLVALLLPGSQQSTQDHQRHHERSCFNMALYFRHLDDWFGTSDKQPSKKPGQSSSLLIIYNLAYYAAVSLLLSHAWQVLAFLCSIKGCVMVLALALLPCPSLDFVRGLSFWDRVRQAYGCKVSCLQPLDPSGKYIFAYHPHGLLSRGFWLVFGLLGKASPLAGHRLALALHKALLTLPMYKQVLGCLGGTDAGKANMLAMLTKGISVAIIPGGWAEASLAQTNKLLLSKRIGFVKLAMETGAHLVPVLGVGESRIGGNGGMLAAAYLLPAKPSQLHVVLGAPMAPEVGESVASFHSRYIEALKELGRQHGVELQII